MKAKKKKLSKRSKCKIKIKYKMKEKISSNNKINQKMINVRRRKQEKNTNIYKTTMG